MRTGTLALLGLFALFSTMAVKSETPVVVAGGKTDLVFFGTYTSKDGSKGIYRAEIDPDGKLSAPVLAAASTNPSFLAIRPGGKSLYAVNEIDNFVPGTKAGAVSAFSIDKATGKLEQLNHMSSGGPAPCHISVHPELNRVAVVNYNGGEKEKTSCLAIFPFVPNGFLASPSMYIGWDGSSVNKARQQGPHAHSANFTPDGKFLLVADLGSDKVLIFPFKKGPVAGALGPKSELKLAPGSGPRHLDLDAKGSRVYVVNELNSTVTVFDREKATELQTITTLPKEADAKKNFPAEIRVHRELGYVYSSNRGHDSIAIFKINPEDGKLTAVGHQQHPQIKTPRGFTLYKNFLIAAGQSTNKIVVFRIDPATGNLKALDDVVDVPTPVCVRVLQR